MSKHEENHPAKKTETGFEELIGSRRINAWILCLPEKEKSPDSAFLKADWRLRGAITRALTSGALSRKPGVVSLLPVTRPVSDQENQTFKILTLGVRERSEISSGEISHLILNIEGLKLKSVGLSAADFGWSKSDAKKNFHTLRGVELCVTD